MKPVNADSENRLSPSVLFEDDQILVMNKPAGLVVHSDGRTEEYSVLKWLSQHYPTLCDVGGLHTLDSGRYVERFGLVHRLDRETSGVLLAAKNSEAFHALQQQFIARTNEKTYVAFVWGVMEKKEGSIELPIGRSRIDFRQWTTGEHARGTLRKAHTEYRVISENGHATFIELHPKTGRTHQLRVHMKAIGFPIICDKRYESLCGLGFSRVALHAQKLNVKHPNGKYVTYEAPLPEDFLSALKHDFQ